MESLYCNDHFEGIVGTDIGFIMLVIVIYRDSNVRRLSNFIDCSTPLDITLVIVTLAWLQVIAKLASTAYCEGG